MKLVKELEIKKALELEDKIALSERIYVKDNKNHMQDSIYPFVVVDSIEIDGDMLYARVKGDLVRVYWLNEYDKITSNLKLVESK